MYYREVWSVGNAALGLGVSTNKPMSTIFFAPASVERSTHWMICASSPCAEGLRYICQLYCLIVCGAYTRNSDTVQDWPLEPELLILSFLRVYRQVTEIVYMAMHFFANHKGIDLYLKCNAAFSPPTPNKWWFCGIVLNLTGLNSWTGLDQSNQKPPQSSELEWKDFVWVHQSQFWEITHSWQHIHKQLLS